MKTKKLTWRDVRDCEVIFHRLAEIIKNAYPKAPPPTKFARHKDTRSPFLLWETATNNFVCVSWCNRYGAEWLAQTPEMYPRVEGGYFDRSSLQFAEALKRYQALQPRWYQRLWNWIRRH